MIRTFFTAKVPISLRERDEPGVIELFTGRREHCDECGKMFRTFRHRPQDFICGTCTPPSVTDRCIILEKIVK